MSNVLKNLAKMTTATTGTGTITLGSAVTGCLSFSDAGVSNNDIVTYAIEDGSNREIGKGTYTSSGTTLSRDTVYSSTSGGSKISLSGSAVVYVSIAAQDIDSKFEHTGGTLYKPSNTPGAPSSDQLKFYIDKKVGGREEPFIRGSAAAIAHLQRTLQKPIWCLYAMGTGSTATFLQSWGGTSGGGTISMVDDATYGLMMQFVTGTSAGNAAGRTTNLSVFRRNAAKFRGGFYAYSRVGLTNKTSMYFYMGFSDVNFNSSSGNADDPGGDAAYFQYSPSRGGSGDTNFQFVTRDGTTQNLADTGVAVTTGKVYDFYIHCQAGASTIYWAIYNITDATSATGSVTNNLPTGTTDMLGGVAAVNTTGGASRNFRTAVTWLEVDETNTV